MHLVFFQRELTHVSRELASTFAELSSLAAEMSAGHGWCEHVRERAISSWMLEVAVVEAGLGGREDRVDFSSGAAARPSDTLGMDRTRSTGELANLDDEEARSSEILLHFLQSECGFAYTSATLYAWARKAGFEGWCDRKRAAFIGSVADSDCGFTDNSLHSLLYTMQRSWRRSVIHRFRGLAQRAGDEERVVASLRAVIDRAFTSAHLEACDVPTQVI